MDRVLPARPLRAAARAHRGGAARARVRPGRRLRLETLDPSGSFAFPARDRGLLEESWRLRDEIPEIKGDTFDAITVVESKTDLGRSSRAENARAMRGVEEEWRARFVSTSARTGENVTAVFRELLARAHLPSRVRQMCARDCGYEQVKMRKPPSCVLSYTNPFTDNLH